MQHLSWAQCCLRTCSVMDVYTVSCSRVLDMWDYVVVEDVAAVGMLAGYWWYQPRFSRSPDVSVPCSCALQG
jgi:hypothetical protein